MKKIRMIGFLFLLTLISCVLISCGKEKVTKDDYKWEVMYSFEETKGSLAKNTVTGVDYNINYVFSEKNADYIFKEANDPLHKTGVKGTSLYMDGFSTFITNNDYKQNSKAITLSAFVAPRAFENLPNYSEESSASGMPRLTGVINKGNMELGEGFLLGYGRLGMWGIQLAVHSNETEEDVVLGFYDPINALPLYEWSHIVATYDGTRGYIGLFYNGTMAYEAIIPELVNSKLIVSSNPLYVGTYSPDECITEFAVERQRVAGLLDEVSVSNICVSPKAINEYFSDIEKIDHLSLEWDQVGLDSSVYAGDRYRPQYHAIPPAVWMNEPHSPFYYNGKYHVMYQHNPTGPYWSQIRWAHIVSEDMVHWEYVKDSVVPTADICPEGVWTGGACIGPDGVPWLVITAGTNTSTWSGQNIAYAHPADPTDPYLSDWVLEDVVVIAQPSDDSQGERDQFRDPFVWRDGDIYYMMVSTSIPGRGGSANIYTSKDMREWENRGYIYECPYPEYEIQGEHWECVILLPITTLDGSMTKYILFDCPQYAKPAGVQAPAVECYYWIGTFDKNTCRFIPDSDEPRLFDYGTACFTGQNGYCFLTDEDIAAGKTNYEDGRTVIYAIAQGKDPGTSHNKAAGWAHNFALPLELYLTDDGTDVIRKPIKELESVRTETLFDYSGEAITANELNSMIGALRGDTLEIHAKLTIAPQSDTYYSAIGVRYNKATGDKTENTKLVFKDNQVFIDRSMSTLYDYVDRKDYHEWDTDCREFEVTIYLDRSMLEIYINGIKSYTTRIYPKYGDSDYLHIFDDSNIMKFTNFTVYRMGSAYTDTLVPSYYGNVGNLS